MSPDYFYEGKGLVWGGLCYVRFNTRVKVRHLVRMVKVGVGPWNALGQ